MQIEALIERLEGLSGPDREVDAWIGYHTNLVVDEMSWRDKIDRFGIEHAVKSATSHQNVWCGALPAYSASLDAAIALVEKVLPGWRIENLGEWDHEQLRSRGPWMCDLMPRGKSFKDCFPAKCAHAPSPAIALLIAMFRALAAGGSDA